MAVDWKELAKQVGDLNPDESEKGSGTESGQRALEILIGEENLRHAVDYFMTDAPGAFTVEMLLKVMRSKAAMARCYEIYKMEPGSLRACNAIFLLGSIADKKALPWVNEFLEDDYFPVRLNGLKVLQTILYGPLNDTDIRTAKELLDRAESDSHAPVRERASQMREHFSEVLL